MSCWSGAHKSCALECSVDSLQAGEPTPAVGREAHILYRYRAILHPRALRSLSASMTFSGWALQIEFANVHISATTRQVIVSHNSGQIYSGFGRHLGENDPKTSSCSTTTRAGSFRFLRPPRQAAASSYIRHHHQGHCRLDSLSFECATQRSPHLLHELQRTHMTPATSIPATQQHQSACL